MSAAPPSRPPLGRVPRSSKAGRLNRFFAARGQPSKRAGEHRLPLGPAHALLGGLLDALLPQTCVACERWTASGELAACPACRAALEVTRALPYCHRCARTMSPFSIHEKGCARCQREPFWNVAGLARGGEYRNETLRRLLVGLKFTGSERQADYLGALLAAAIRKKAWLTELDALVPVPMHRLRRWQRPGEHARLLAEAVSRRLGVPVRRAAVRRVKYSISQTRTLSSAERFRNVRDCFGPARKPKITGKTVCIIDNLLVSGATIHEVSKVLRKAGAKRIYAAVVARTTLPGDPQPQLEPLTPPPDQPD
ncbi:MAG: ComF family protein [Phycisphaerae bacterium]